MTLVPTSKKFLRKNAFKGRGTIASTEASMENMSTFFGEPSRQQASSHAKKKQVYKVMVKASASFKGKNISANGHFVSHSSLNHPEDSSVHQTIAALKK